MRILMLGCKEYPYGSSSKFEKFSGGGTAKYVIALSEGLAKKGHEIHLIVRKFPGQKQYEKINGLNIHRVNFIRGKLFILPSFSFFSYLEARRLNKKYDIIHTHNPFAAYFALKLKKEYNKKIIGTMHGIASTQVKGFGKKAVGLVSYLEKKTYPKFNKIIFLNENDKIKFESIHNLKLKNTEVIHSGIELNKIPIKKIKHQGFNILFVGRLEHVKAVDNFVESYKYLPENIKTKITYTIVGNGSLMPRLKEIIKENNIKNISLEGFQENTEKYYLKSDLLILPSYSEGFPITLLEAMSYKVPCLINNFKTPFSKESLITMKDNNAKTIAEIIKKIYLKKISTKDIINHAFEEIHNNFSFNKLLETQIGGYEQL